MLKNYKKDKKNSMFGGINLLTDFNFKKHKYEKKAANRFNRQERLNTHNELNKMFN